LKRGAVMQFGLCIRVMSRKIVDKRLVTVFLKHRSQQLANRHFLLEGLGKAKYVLYALCSRLYQLVIQQHPDRRKKESIILAEHVVSVSNPVGLVCNIIRRSFSHMPVYRVT